MSTPFNPVAHDFLIANGFERARIDASYEDVGNGETGPMLTGGPAFDEYNDYSAGITICISEDGSTGYEVFDPDSHAAMQRFLGTQSFSL